MDIKNKIITTVAVVGLLGVGAVGGSLLTESAKAESATYEEKNGEVLKGIKVPIDIGQVKIDLSANQTNRTDLQLGCQAEIKVLDEKIANGQADVDAYNQLKPLPEPIP